MTLICANKNCGKVIMPQDVRVKCFKCDNYYHIQCTQLLEGLTKEEAFGASKMVRNQKIVRNLYACIECEPLINYEALKGNAVIGEMMTKLANEYAGLRHDVAVIPKLTDLSININEKVDILSGCAGKTDDKIDLMIKGDERYSSILKKSFSQMPAKPSILLKPLDAKAKRADVYDAVKENLDENEFDLAGTRLSKTNNNVVVMVKDKENQEKFIAEATAKLGDHFEIKAIKDMRPRIKIVNAIVPKEDNKSLADVEKFIKEKNEDLRDAVMVAAIPRKKHNSSIDDAFDLIMEVNAKTFYAYVEDGKRVRSSWTTSRVVEGIKVKRCIRCLRFGHIKDRCRDEHVTCAKCGGNHMSDKCTPGTPLKCVNCVDSNKNHKTEYDTEHNSLSGKCPCYKIRYEKLANAIHFE